MGLTNEYKIVVSYTQAYIQLGNAVVVSVIEYLAGIYYRLFDLLIKKIDTVRLCSKKINNSNDIITKIIHYFNRNYSTMNDYNVEYI